ncbi:glycoside hydrolase family 5 protein [Streptomyces profundus]|uniref:glycoside hydrolase family 5 protein n=1 Tax=Streptomyces profundus TaxID=2867410 RepID=UPI001D166FD3|nr:cellulase family glycosylhydrolase [Streptomyces sp. MA3_2.13]UED82935.1 glycoside hydrolase family 5 protein [Streptomyces sp. MA3_2.13]
MPPFRSRHPRRSLSVTLSVAVAGSLVALSSAGQVTAADRAAEPAPQAAADFRGVNWAAPGDNFTDGPVVPEGLSESDDYDTVKAKASVVYDQFQSTVGANTVRLPINFDSYPGTTWGDSYAGAIDAASESGLNVIISLWEGASANGRIDDLAGYNALWDAVVERWGDDGRVHFEPMNEPYAYTPAEWADIAAAWIEDRPSVPRERILVSGHGYNGDVTAVCADSRLDGTYLSLHLYAFQFAEMSYDQWRDTFDSRIGDCGSRTVLDEFGAPLDDGRDYDHPDSDDNFVRYLRAATDTVRAEGMGAVYWPALGGKHTNRPDHDWYSLYAIEGSGTDLTLTVRNESAVNRLHHAWAVTN